MKPICLFDALKNVLKSHRLESDNDVKAMVITVFPAAAEETLYRKYSTSGVSVGCLSLVPNGDCLLLQPEQSLNRFHLNRLCRCFISLITFLY
jgi:hypothetical protein